MTISIVADTVLTKQALAGYPFRVLGLLKGYSSQGIKVQLFLCNRNFTKTRELSWLKELGNNIELFVINPQYFYKKLFLNKLLQKKEAGIIQFENPEFVINATDFIVDNIEKKIFILELHNLYYKLTKEKKDFDLIDEALRMVDYTICFSREDAKMLSGDFREKRSKILFSPIFINSEDYPLYGPNLKGNNLLSMGNLYHKPNVRAAEFLIYKVYPSLKKWGQDFHIHFLGMCPKKFLKTTSSFYTFHGFVKNREQILKKIKLCVAPIFSGYGSRVKLFEYAAFGFPILSTKEGIIGAEKLKGLFVAGRMAFPEELIKILFQDSLLIRSGLNNRISIKQYYDTKIVVPELLSKITKKPRHRILLRIKSSKKMCLPPWLKEKRHERMVLKENYIINENVIRKIKF